MDNLAAPPPNDVARLCQACQEAINHIGPLNLSPGEPHTYLDTEYWLKDRFPRLPKLEISSRQGCDFCDFLREIILSGDTDDGLKRILGKSAADLGALDVDISLTYGLVAKENPAEPGLHILEVCLSFEGVASPIDLICFVEAAADCPDAEAAAELLGLAEPSNQSYTDRETIRWMKAKIKACEKHEHGLAADGFIPERLLDVRRGRPRVVLRSDLVTLRKTRSNVGDQVPKYSALSYCWGSNSEAQLKTTTDSLPDRLFGIDKNEMTAVLRDAVQITKSLSINYLWVDALCILQDDISDWERQCVNMDKIYGNAHITLRAESSRSFNEGFLSQKGRRITLPFQSSLLHSKKGLLCIQFKYVESAHRNRTSDSDILYSDYRLSRLSNRGWAFQETVLSIRVLMFGHANVHFFCGDSYQTRDMGTEDYPYYAMISECGLMKEQRQRLFDIWDGVIHAYTKFTKDSFTKFTDTLPALSGLAAIFQRQLQDDYIAGLWKKTLFHSLAWYCLPPSNPLKADLCCGHQLESAYLVPSWSLLSRGYMDFLQAHNKNGLKAEVKEINAQVDLVGENPLGAITSGELIIRSNVVDMASLGDLEIRSQVVDNPYFGYGLLVDGQFLGNFTLDFRFDGRDILGEMRAFRWVLLGSYEVPEAFKALKLEGSCDRGAYGLIICPAQVPNKFYRIGIFEPRVEIIVTPENQKNRFFEVGNLHLFKELSEVETVTII
ncbi:HET-domain-containing protein [Hyaloscypha hepaticicola]|uniref:HET-domain-containing protein n=1 Tax=Hyaloscypha hepaticicola TaxID=2082293 RepID=A0A2J6Q1G3_9HELO|nr:HET-domain-containing protein [Hyaloscypha hepaticicola]